MAKAKGSVNVISSTNGKKKTRQGLGRGTKYNSNPRSKRFKKKYRGQGKC